jgi:Cell wall-active antibiotics response 4TMS YvqF
LAPTPGEPGGPAPAGSEHPLFSAGQLGPHAVPSAHGTGYPTAPLPVSGPAAYTGPVPPTAGPASGYRPPFAPHGPYAPGGSYPHHPGPGAPVPRPPKPPRERSPLGAATFSMIFAVIGLVAALDLSGVVPIGPSAYFAGILVTTALGLLVGAWFGRARWLIAIGLAAALALGISTFAESADVQRLSGGPVLWRPTSVGELASGYENSFGDATLDLTAVDFTADAPPVTVRVNFGRLVVVVPQQVDVTAVTDVNAGDATVFGERWSGMQGAAREVTDFGPDGRGGGTLHLDLHVNAGELEVRR